MKAQRQFRGREEPSAALYEEERWIEEKEFQQLDLEHE